MTPWSTFTALALRQATGAGSLAEEFAGSAGNALHEPAHCIAIALPASLSGFCPQWPSSCPLIDACEKGIAAAGGAIPMPIGIRMIAAIAIRRKKAATTRR
jgi:hypothetical protein